MAHRPLSVRQNGAIAAVQHIQVTDIKKNNQIGTKSAP
jgi:hypothetical protein